MRNGGTSAGGDWSDAISEATRHVEERVDAQTAVVEHRSPISRRLLTIVASAVLTVLIAANVWVALQPISSPGTMLYARGNRAWTVADAADIVEDFRLDHGRLPSGDEVAEDLGTAVSYQSSGDRYVISLAEEGSSLRYDSSIALEDWLASMTGVGESGVDAAGVGESGVDAAGVGETGGSET